MSRTSFALAMIAVLTGVGALAGAAAEDPAKPRAPADRASESEVAQYCRALSPSAAEARAALALRRLADLERRVREQLDGLEAKEASARDWVAKREEMMKAANDDVVAIYAKMDAESAAAQLAVMDEPAAAAVLTRLKPAAAGAILAGMPPDKAAKLSTMMVGSTVADKS